MNSLKVVTTTYVRSNLSGSSIGTLDATEHFQGKTGYLSGITKTVYLLDYLQRIGTFLLNLLLSDA